MNLLQLNIASSLKNAQKIEGRDVQPKNEKHVFLSYGSPNPVLFPTKAYINASNEVLNTRAEIALQYRGGQGTEQIKNWIISRGHHRHMSIEHDGILITAGAAQGIDFATRLLIDPGDEVWVESPSYFFALQSFQLAGARISSIPLDDDGINIDIIEKKLNDRIKNLKKLPKCIYIMPNYHNPTGVSLSLERRKRLAILAEKYNLVIIEDDAYAELSFNQHFLPSIHSLAPKNVIYLGTFSKIIAPGIRIGWVIADKSLIKKMELFLLGPQISPVIQEIIGTLLINLSFDDHLGELVNHYKHNRDVMVGEIVSNFGNHVSFNIPKGGFFIWLQFKNDIDLDELANIAFDKGVSFVKGKEFYHQANKLQEIRLCYSYCNTDEIKEGIRLLAEAYDSLTTQ